MKLGIKELLKFGSPEGIIEAVIEVQNDFDENPPDGVTTGSDVWTIDMSYYRPIMISRVRQKWAALMTGNGDDWHQCPFSDHTIVLMWNAVRKDGCTVADLNERVQKLRAQRRCV